MISSELEYGLHGAKVASRRDPLLVGGAIEVQQKYISKVQLCRSMLRTLSTYLLLAPHNNRTITGQ